ncbi:pumilio homolog 12-like [Cicer arietinum]
MNESLGNNVSWVNNNVNVNGNGNGNGRRSPHWFDDFRGRVYSLAKDQHGSRILQEVIKKFGSEGVSYIFSELVNHVTELMIDPFGNYVVQKMVEICNEDQQTRIVLMVTYHSFQLIRICLSPHGSRAVEKLLENVTTREQRTLIMAALSPGAIALSKDINGHRVVLHCLKNFTHEDTKQFLNVVASNSLAIARDKTGCCVLQHCVNHAQGETRNQLIDDIVLNSSLLAEDCYGNYVVQHLLSLKMPRITDNLVRELERQFVYLACNKYGSNVVEKFIQDSGELQSARVILELLADPNVARLLVDPYGNYVIQSALTASKGPIRNAILDLIQRNSQMMRNNVYGKKLLDRFDKGKVRHNI